MTDLKATAIKTAAAVYHASVVVQQYYTSGNYSVSSKGKEGPLTSADLAADRILRKALLDALPGSGWLSEETPDNEDRLKCPYVWIVDPVDGTRDFVNGTGEFSVSAGLVFNGVPVIGCVSMPAEGKLALGYNGTVEKWTFRPDVRAGFQEQILDPGKATDACIIEPVVSNRSLDGGTAALENSNILISRSEHKKGVFNSHPKNWKLSPEGSVARKIAKVALGEAPLNISLYPKNEWDICGGCALLENAGLDYRTLDPVAKPSFNKPDPVSYGFVAGRAELVQQYIRFFEENKIVLRRQYGS